MTEIYAYRAQGPPKRSTKKRSTCSGGPFLFTFPVLKTRGTIRFTGCIPCDFIARKHKNSVDGVQHFPSIKAWFRPLYATGFC